MYKILILKKADDDLEGFLKGDRSSYVKCFNLLRDIMTDPRSGIGKPERLKHYEDREVYSRKINKKDRMRYEIYEEEKLVEIIVCKGHYGD